MGLVNTKKLMSTRGNQYLMTFDFDTNSTSTPDGLTPAYTSPDFVVARTGVGVYTVTFAATKKPLDMAFGTAEILGTEPGLRAEVTGYVPSTGVLTIKVYQLATPAWTTGIAVTAHAATLATAGWVVGVTGVTADGAGAKAMQSTATPAAGAVRVEYTAGVATLTFNDTDNVSVASAQIIPATPALADTTDKTIQVALVCSRSNVPAQF